MKNSRHAYMLAVALCISNTGYAQQKAPQLGKDPVSSVLKAMTLAEEASLVVGTGMRFGSNSPVIGEADGRVPGAAGNTMSIGRLNIPGTVLADGPAGVRIDPFHKGDSTKSFYATAFPVGTLLASSWDTVLVKKVGLAFGNEIKAYGIDVILGPGMNIQRNPLNGRNFEYFSEDPLISGYMAASMIKGVQANGVGTSMKHFAANNQETSRNFINAIISERALREIYLKGFEIAVKTAQPWTVMSSYNKINGTYTSESEGLLTEILRNEWGFRGIVMTDWYGGKDVVSQMKAGNDLIEPGDKRKSQQIIDAVNNGTLDKKVLDRNVERILNYILKTPSFAKYKYSNQPNLKAHASIARTAAAESIVLLKNEEHTLPLKKDLKLALFGNGSYQTITGGTGSGDVFTAYAVSIVDGLSNAGFVLNKDLAKIYSTYIQQDKLAHPKKGISLGTPRLTPELTLTSTNFDESAEKSDVAVFTISRTAGEGADRKVEDNFNLTENEREYLKRISHAFHARGKKLIVILNIGGVIETVSWRDYADGIVLVWQPGQEAGNAITDILSGVVDPSGKLAVTFPIIYEDVPSSKNFPGTPVEKPLEVRYDEGIYVGYRYHSTFGIKPSYEFGYGLSYTKFSHNNLRLSSSSFNKRLVARVTITNEGKVAGKEVVQLYVAAPQKTLDKPAQELRGFAKTRLLKPGESQTISFTLLAKDLASFNTERSAWIADAGNYSLKIGASSSDFKLVETFSLGNEIIVEKVKQVLKPEVLLNELKK